jgi:hypothetical protein
MLRRSRRRPSTNLVGSLHGDVLTATLPNQKIYELEPVRGSSFVLKGENASTVDFKRDPSGRITAQWHRSQGKWK